MLTKKNKELIVDVSVGALLGVAIIAALFFNKEILSFFNPAHSNESSTQIVKEDKTINKTYFGYDTSEYYFEEGRVKNNEILGSILYWEGVRYSIIDKLVQKSKDVFDVRQIRANKKLTFVRKDSCGALHSLIYQPNDLSYVIFNVADSVYVTKNFRPVETKVEFATGVVESSLWNSMKANNLSNSLIDEMEDALSSEVDFYHAKKGDKYKLLYERKYIDNKPVSIGKLLGAYYYHNEPKFSVYYEAEKYNGYYNYKGQATKKAFLRAPVRFSRISSRFSNRRFHPILHRVKAHYGTDYAAPYGTPILAVAAGTITRKGYGKGNGNYITIRHDKQYSTTYLHMQRFGKGMKKGVHVSQGQVIGYIGSTGLATGPHVCFRMKKNGKPINHLRENFPSPEPLPDTILQKFYVVRDSILKLMKSLDNDIDSLKQQSYVLLEKSDTIKP